MIYSGEGAGGFYRGLSTTLVRAVPASIVMFVSFEWSRAMLLRYMHT